MATEIGDVVVTYTATGIARFEVVVENDVLGKIERLRSDDCELLVRKAAYRAEQWDEQEERAAALAAAQVAKMAVVEQRAAAKAAQDEAAALRAAAAAEAEAQSVALTSRAEAVHERLRHLLGESLARDPAFEWAVLRSDRQFPTPRPAPPPLPPPPGPVVALPPPACPSLGPQPSPPRFAREPTSADPQFRPRFSILDMIWPRRRRLAQSAAQDRFDAAHARWERGCQRATEHFERKTREWHASRAEALRQHALALVAYERRRVAMDEEHCLEVRRHEEQVAALEQRYSEALRVWEEGRERYLAEQQAANMAVDERRSQYIAGDRSAIVEYCERVLEASDYPECIPRAVDIEYLAETGMLVVDLQLPAKPDLPTLVKVRYAKSDDQLRETHLRENQLGSLYDEVVYQIVLRTMDELLRADRAGHVRGVTINGIVHFVDPATGHAQDTCILSLQTSPAEFGALNLDQVDARECFRRLKGVGSPKLHTMTPVAPVLALGREDRRFVPAYSVAPAIDEGTNLAAIDWQDFEHLIREVFEWELAQAGGEVKVTQASRDGGVDAIAYDPDPIRGGKIVIQAKRYTGVVGVAAVRDLYGTVMNEGATKGILVTTSSYGSDAYEFARGKPLTLLTGSHLLHLLRKHGRKAYIDLREARAAAT